MTVFEPTHRAGHRLSFSISSNEAIFPRDQVELVRTIWLNHSVESPIDGDRITRWRQATT